MVIEKTPNGERAYDIYSRLLKERIVFLNSDVNEATANLIIAQMLYLNSVDKDADINFYINSPGGSVYHGLGIYDTMQFISNKVNTICVGYAASMGAFLLAAGDRRIALPNSRVMIHQPSSGAQGQATDLEINLKETLALKEKLTRILAKNAGQEYEKVLADCERDKWFGAEEALAYGLIDEISQPNQKKIKT